MRSEEPVIYSNVPAGKKETPLFVFHRYLTLIPTVPTLWGAVVVRPYRPRWTGKEEESLGRLKFRNRLTGR